MRKTVALSFLILAGCNVQSRYERPQINAPTSWRVNMEEEASLANALWWESFGDPVLNTLIETALHNNQDLQVAIARVCEFYGQFEVARAPLYPQVSGDGVASKQRFSEQAGLLPPGFNNVFSDYNLNVNLNYEIDLWGQLRNAKQAAYAQFLAEVENRRTVVLTLVGAVAQGYFLLRQLDSELKIAKETLESRKESLEIATYRFQGGLTSEIEVTQATSLYEEAAARVNEFERRIPQQENDLSVLLGQNPGPIVRGKALDQFVLPHQLPPSLPSELLTRRPDIIQAENELMAAHAQIGVARAAFFPQISLTSLYGGNSLNLKDLFTKANRTWELGGQLAQSIFTGGQLMGQLHMAKAQEKEALHHYQQVILNAFREVDNALIAFEKAKDLISIEQANVNALAEYVKLSWLKYYEGQTQYLTVLDAERELFGAQLQLEKAKGIALISFVAIYKALGGGWVKKADHEVTQQDPGCVHAQPKEADKALH